MKRLTGSAPMFLNVWTPTRAVKPSLVNQPFSARALMRKENVWLLTPAFRGQLPECWQLF